ncbi:DUF6890 family protein [Halodesulfovibrio aestuarii]
MVFSHKWFPGQKATEKTMAEAMFLENDYWKKMEIAIANGSSRAFCGR